jgi:TonB family protein
MVVENQLKLSTDRLHVAGESGAISPSPGPWDAPETALGQWSPAADVWSLGVVLVQALTQRPPLWSDPSHREPVVPASVPPRFYGVAQQCLQMDPARRCTLSSIRALLDAAPAAQPSRKIRPTPPSRTTPQLSKSQPSWAKLIVASAVVVVGAIIAALVVASNQRPSPPAIQQSPATATQPPQGSVVQGAVTFRAIPNVPQDIRDAIEGHIRVRIALEVDASGNVSAAAIDSTGPSQYFANKALAAAWNWKFTPAQRDGHAVPSQWTLQYSFGQDETTITPTETSP